MATTPNDAAFDVINGFVDPVFLVELGGAVRFSNLAARRLLGTDPAGCPLHTFFATDRGSVCERLRLWGGSRSPLPAALTLKRPDCKSVRVPCFGSRVASGDAAGWLILIHCNDVQSERMSALKTSLRALQDEVKQRRRAQALAEEALRDRELMLRELQHRVKNNIQVVLTLVRGAMREMASDEARAILEMTYARLSAATTVQQLLYQTREYQTVDIAEMLQSIVSGLAIWVGDEHKVDLHAEGGELPNNAALPVALIINELLTNSIKYGRSEHGIAEVDISLVRDGNRFTLEVADRGPGYEVEESVKQASGLGLVRGLARQLGGSFQVDADEGSRTTIKFEVRG